jgi:hypothetical protein
MRGSKAPCTAGTGRDGSGGPTADRKSRPIGTGEVTVMPDRSPQAAVSTAKTRYPALSLRTPRPTGDSLRLSRHSPSRGIWVMAASGSASPMTRKAVSSAPPPSARLPHRGSDQPRTPWTETVLYCFGAQACSPLPPRIPNSHEQVLHSFAAPRRRPRRPPDIARRHPVWHVLRGGTNGCRIDDGCVRVFSVSLPVASSSKLRREITAGFGPDQLRLGWHQTLALRCACQPRTRGANRAACHRRLGERRELAGIGRGVIATSSNA